MREHETIVSKRPLRQCLKHALRLAYERGKFSSRKFCRETLTVLTVEPVERRYRADLLFFFSGSCI